MQLEPSVLQKLQIAYDIVADILGQAPQLYDCHLLVLVLSMKRARRSRKLRQPRQPGYQDQYLPF